MAHFIRIAKHKYSVLLTLIVFAVNMSGILCLASQKNELAEEQHYATVWAGENGFSHMNIYIVSAFLDEEPLAVGDEIAVFSGNLCVGAVRLSSPSNGGLINLVASLDDGTGNGFTNGDTIVYKIWDNSAQQEKEVLEVLYRNELSNWLVSGRFGFNGSSFVDIVGGTLVSQKIELTEGWNIVSGNVVSQSPDMLDVMDSLIIEEVLLKVQDESGGSAEDFGDFGGWINSIGDFKETEGYKVKVNRDCSFSMRGVAVNIPINIQLTEGWNIISFPLSYAVNAMDVVQSLISDGKLEKVKDERGNSIEDWGIYGGWINNIGDFVPGEGYEVKVKSSVVLTISSTYTKSQAIYSEASAPIYFSPCFEGNGADHMNINVLDVSSMSLEAGDEIAVFDGDLCVGASVITSETLQENAVAVNVASALGDDFGFTQGNIYDIKIWKSLTAKELDVKPVVLKGESVFARYESSFVKLEVASPIKEMANFSEGLSVYPNPTRGIVNVVLPDNVASASYLEVLDVAGKVIKTKHVNAGAISSFNLTDEKAGLYFVKAVVGGIETVARIVLN